MPYGVNDNVWNHLPADDRASIAAAWQRANAAAPEPGPVPAPAGATVTHPVQPVDSVTDALVPPGARPPASRPGVTYHLAPTAIAPAAPPVPATSVNGVLPPASAGPSGVTSAAQGGIAPLAGLPSPASHQSTADTTESGIPTLARPSIALTESGKGLPPIVSRERPPHPWTDPSRPRGPHYTDAQLRSFGATPAEVWIIDHESGGYTHAWNYSPTATGFAYGLGQVTGLFRRHHFGRNWESADPRLHIKMMQAYIKHGSVHFHNDAGALAFWKANGWY